MKILYFVPILSVLGLSLSVYADSEQDTLQTWIDYVDEYRQYMEEYREWASDRFEYYENRISELVDQLDENNNLIYELEEDIQHRNERIEELEQRIDDLTEEEEYSINHPTSKPESTPDTNIQNHTTEQDPQREIYITTDKQIYNHGDTMVVTVKKTNPTRESTISTGSFVITSPNGNVIAIDKFETYDEREHEFLVMVGGPLWEQPPGMFTIGVQIGTQDSYAETQFEVIPRPHITTYRPTYTLGDVILITGQAEMIERHETTNLKGETTPASLEPPSNIWIIIEHHNTSYQIQCSTEYNSGSSCSSHQTTILDPEYNDDGTFSFGIEIEDHLPIGEYTILSTRAGNASFTLIPPN